MKKHTLTLDLDSPFEGWAFLLFRTPHPAYAFADILNRLYDYRLARTDDLILHDTPWPLFLHHDPIRHLLFFLVQQPLSATGTPWAPGDKLLLVRGDNADSITHTIHRDFTSPPLADPADLLATEHADLLHTLLSDFSVAIPLDFDTVPASPKAVKEQALAQRYCNLILDHIESHRLDLSPDELLCSFLQ